MILHRLISRSVRQAIENRPHLGFARLGLRQATRHPQRPAGATPLGPRLAGSQAVTFVVFLLAALMVLSELGFNVTTIVASTSVVAVTVGFGMQNLIKDLLSGVFMLVEDQLGVGDYVDMEKASGTVEAVGLRVTQLRRRRQHGVVRPQRRGAAGRQLQPGRPGRSTASRP